MKWNIIKKGNLEEIKCDESCDWSVKKVNFFEKKKRKFVVTRKLKKDRVMIFFYADK